MKIGPKKLWNANSLFRRARKAGQALAAKQPVPIVLRGTKFRNPTPIKIGQCANADCRYKNESETALCTREDCTLTK